MTKKPDRITTVSCPGKVLMLGGYVVLDERFAGYVLATDARFYCTVESVHSVNGYDTDFCHVSVKSPQFTKSDRRYLIYRGTTIQSRSQPDLYYDDLIRLQSAAREMNDNDFIDVTLKVVLSLLRVHAIDNKTGFPFKIYITIAADNDFYSQSGNLKNSGSSSNVGKLIQLPKFALMGTTVSNVQKTGLGSSAALVSSLVSCLMINLFHYDQDMSEDCSQQLEQSNIVNNNAIMSRIHNTAQLCHFIAQGKVGSGFDVSAALFGSQRFQTWSRQGLESALDVLRQNSVTKLKSVIDGNDQLWSQKVLNFKLPSWMQIVLADVHGGSSTPSMVKKVLQWKTDNPESGEELFQSLHAANQAVAVILEELCEIESSTDELSQLAQVKFSFKESGNVLPDGIQQSKAYKLLCQVREAMLGVRQKMRQLSEFAGVEIEPPTQTELLDRSDEIEGVIASSCPGAGGYDAIYCLVINSDQVVNRLDSFWQSYSSTSTADHYSQVKVQIMPTRASSDCGLKLERETISSMIHIKGQYL
ncbi:hypothetical protein MP228_008555 [Amoeboaphelidium protococcarum]|nr:hypothetical protein MP228_008555 [Amoeboaphelidium protococcarum]